MPTFTNNLQAQAAYGTPQEVYIAPLPFQELAMAGAAKQQQFNVAEQLLGETGDIPLKVGALPGEDEALRNAEILRLDKQIEDIYKRTGNDLPQALGEIKKLARETKKELLYGKTGAIQREYDKFVDWDKRQQDRLKSGHIKEQDYLTERNQALAKYNASGGIGEFDPVTGKYNRLDIQDVADFQDIRKDAREIAQSMPSKKGEEFEAWKQSMQTKMPELWEQVKRGVEYKDVNEIYSDVMAALANDPKYDSYLSMKERHGLYNVDNALQSSGKRYSDVATSANPDEIVAMGYDPYNEDDLEKYYRTKQGQAIRSKYITDAVEQAARLGEFTRVSKDKRTEKDEMSLYSRKKAVDDRNPIIFTTGSDIDLTKQGDVKTLNLVSNINNGASKISDLESKISFETNPDVKRRLVSQLGVEKSKLSILQTNLNKAYKEVGLTANELTNLRSDLGTFMKNKYPMFIEELNRHGISETEGLEYIEGYVSGNKDGIPDLPGKLNAQLNSIGNMFEINYKDKYKASISKIKKADEYLEKHREDLSMNTKVVNIANKTTKGLIEDNLNSNTGGWQIMDTGGSDVKSTDLKKMPKGKISIGGMTTEKLGTDHWFAISDEEGNKYWAKPVGENNIAEQQAKDLLDSGDEDGINIGKNIIGNAYNGLNYELKANPDSKKDIFVNNTFIGSAKYLSDRGTYVLIGQDGKVIYDSNSKGDKLPVEFTDPLKLEHYLTVKHLNSLK